MVNITEIECAAGGKILAGSAGGLGIGEVINGRGNQRQVVAPRNG